MTGASIGFLWYNAHPAEIFMGDVGSLSLGGAMGVVAVLIKQELLLVFIGGVYMLEGMSVILQVGSYKLRGQAHLQDGAAAPSLRSARLAGIEDHHRFWIAGSGPGAVRADHTEAAMKYAARRQNGAGRRNGQIRRRRDGAAAATRSDRVRAADERPIQTGVCCRRQKRPSRLPT